MLFSTCNCLFILPSNCNVLFSFYCRSYFHSLFTRVFSLQLHMPFSSFFQIIFSDALSLIFAHLPPIFRCCWWSYLSLFSAGVHASLLTWSSGRRRGPMTQRYISRWFVSVINHRIDRRRCIKSFKHLFLQFSTTFLYFSQVAKLLPFLHATINPIIYW